MKKLLIAAAAVGALASFGVTSASAGTNWSQVCTANGNYSVSHGECVSILTRYDNNPNGSDDVAAYCKAFQVVDPTNFDAFFKNRGDCIKQLKPFF